MQVLKNTLWAAGALAIAVAGGAQAAHTTTTDFESGAEGWDGPQGFGGSTFIDPTGGVGGSAGLRTQFNDFGITFYNSTNQGFLGDYTAYSQVSLSIDLKVDQIGTFLPVPRPFLVELRSFDLAADGYPWASVWYLFDYVSQDTYSEFTTLSVTIPDTSSTDLPAGWGGYGAEDPNTFEPILPAGVTFADVLADVDEIAFTTFQPGFFFTQDDYDMTVDNISITTIPAPGALALMGLAGLVGGRRRRA